MPDKPVVYEDVEVLEDDGPGFVCRIGSARTFVAKYVPLPGTTVQRKGDRGSLALPRWFAEQQGLPLDRRPSDGEVERWFAEARFNAAGAQEYADRHPLDADAQDALDRATAELTAAMLLYARRKNRTGS
jgi:hypothetical protein